jgi:hypothetical protein
MEVGANGSSSAVEVAILFNIGTQTKSWGLIDSNLATFQDAEDGRTFNAAYTRSQVKDPRGEDDLNLGRSKKIGKA